VTRCAVIASVLIGATLPSCRTPREGRNDLGATVPLDPDEIPRTPLAASLRGEPIADPGVRLIEEEDATRIEILDRRPVDPCAPVPEAQGFVVRVPGRLESGTRIGKAPDEHPRGVSAYMVVRGPDGSASSLLAYAWSFAIEIGPVDSQAGTVGGRIALGIEGADRGVAAGTFEARYCPLPVEE